MFNQREIRLEGPRIYVRSPKRSDFHQWRSVREDSQAHLQPWEPVWPGDANSYKAWTVRLHAWRKAMRHGRGIAFFIFHSSSNTLLGGISLSQIRYGAAMTALLGYWLGASAEKKGYMSEAVRLVCEWAHDELGLQRIEAGILQENERSQNVLVRCGFKREGIARAYLQIAGKRRDHVMYAFVPGIDKPGI